MGVEEQASAGRASYSSRGRWDAGRPSHFAYIVAASKCCDDGIIRGDIYITGGHINQV